MSTDELKRTPLNSVHRALGGKMVDFGGWDMPVQYKAGVVIIVFNNGMYGTIRMHQEKEFPARVSGTELHNPDFAALARAFGGSGEVVNTTAEFAPALERALTHSRQHNLPALIELRYDGNLITPGATLETMRKIAQDAGK